MADENGKTTAVATQAVPGVPDPVKPEIGVLPDDTMIGFGNAASFALLQRAGAMLANSTLVPKEFQGKIPNCIVAMNMAVRMGCDPLMVMQNLYIVYNRPSWSSQFLIATFNMNPAFSKLRYKFVGEPGKDSYGCFAYATDRESGEVLEGATVTVKIAKDEGWYDRKKKDSTESASKWPTMTQQMLMYRSASWFIRVYAPEIAMGFQTVDEMEDFGEPERERNITNSAKVIERIGEAVVGASSSLDQIVAIEEAKKELASGNDTSATTTDAEKKPEQTQGPEKENPMTATTAMSGPETSGTSSTITRDLFSGRKKREPMPEREPGMEG